MAIPVIFPGFIELICIKAFRVTGIFISLNTITFIHAVVTLLFITLHFPFSFTMSTGLLLLSKRSTYNSKRKYFSLDMKCIRKIVEVIRKKYYLISWESSSTSCLRAYGSSHGICEHGGVLLNSSPSSSTLARTLFNKSATTPATAFSISCPVSATGRL